MKYSPEIKQALVARYCNGESVESICLQTGVARSTFYTWIKPHTPVISKSGHTVTAAEFAKMKSHIAKLEQEIEVLQKVKCTVSSPLREKLQELAQLYGQYSVHVLCDALKVSRGTLYNHVLRNKKGDTIYQARRAYLREEIRKVYEENHRIFGPKKVRAVLSQRGESVTDKMVAELMSEMGLTSIRANAKKVHMRSNPKQKKDLLKLNFFASAPNQAWVSDITRFEVKEKAHYVCVIMDLFSRKIIAYKISKKQSSQLVASTFKIAYKNRNPPAGLIFHSDRGTQYTANNFCKLLRDCSIKQSFSPSGKPCHNAVMESFYSHMKEEWLYWGNYHSVKQFEDSVDGYIDFFNNKRPHATLKYYTPTKYEQAYYSFPSSKTN